MFILLLFFGCLQGVKKRQTDDLKRFLGRLRKRVRPRLHHRTLLWFAHIRWSHPNVQTHQKNPVHNSWLCVVEEEKETKKKGTMASTQSCTMCTTCSCCKPWMIASRTAVPMSGAAHPPSGAVLRSRTCAVTRLLSFPHLQMRLLVLLPRLLGLPLQQWKRPFRSTRCPLHSFRPSFCFVLLISLR